MSLHNSEFFMKDIFVPFTRVPCNDTADSVEKKTFFFSNWLMTLKSSEVSSIKETF